MGSPKKKVDFLIAHRLSEIKKRPICNLISFIEPINSGEFLKSFNNKKKKNFVLKYGGDKHRPADSRLTRQQIKNECFYRIEKLLKLKTSLKSNCPSKEIYSLYKALIERNVLERELYLLIGKNKKFTTIAKKIYPLPSRNIYIKAEKILKQFSLQKKEKPNSIRISSFEFSKILKKFFKLRGVTDLNIILDDKMNSKVKVVRKTFENQLRIHIKKTPNGLLIGKNELNETLWHEFIHLLRDINGQRQPLVILQAGTGYYLKTDEGLATYFSLKKSEDVKNKRISSSLAEKALRTMVLSWALKDDNQTIYEKIRLLGFDSQTAAVIILRVRRGTDGSPGFVLPRDGSVYYPGLLEVENFIQKKVNKGWPEKRAVNLLLQGKFAISDLKILEKITEFKKRNYR